MSESTMVFILIKNIPNTCSKVTESMCLVVRFLLNIQFHSPGAALSTSVSYYCVICFLSVKLHLRDERTDNVCLFFRCVCQGRPSYVVGTNCD